MSDTKVGQLIDGTYQRDAIHVAIAPMEAFRELVPGERLKLGIVDPFLTEPVKAGEWFYLFLYPNTVTGMRHHWEHPEIDAVTETNPIALESIKFIAMMADRCGVTVDDLMSAASRFIRFGDYYYSGQNERYKDVWTSWPEFWKHYESITGLKCDDTNSAPFSCSC